MNFSGFPGGSEVKASACNAGDLGSIPGLGKSPGEWNGNPLQYSCLENPIGGEAWWPIVHGVAKSQTQLSDFTHSLTQWIFQLLYSSDTEFLFGSFYSFCVFVDILNMFIHHFPDSI